jgi:ABC-type maltose transport system permease subunit
MLASLKEKYEETAIIDGRSSCSFFLIILIPLKTIKTITSQTFIMQFKISMLLATFASAALGLRVVPDSAALAEAVSGIDTTQDGCHRSGQSGFYH